jgi:DNA (cytosine-5)-methyltransferase 1
MISAVDMFCGLGGWTTAARRTGEVDVRVAVNHDADAIRWHGAAHPETLHIEQDVAEVDWNELRSSVGGGLIIASPACQGFSEAGQPARVGTGGNGTVNIGALMGAHKGKRNTAMAVISAADVLEPEALVIENVERFLSWRLFTPWCGMLEALGYEVRTHVLNAADYGSAQDRSRAIITASRRGAIDLAPEWGAGRTGGLTMSDCLDPDGSPEHRWASVDSKPDRTRGRIRDEQRKAGKVRGILNNVSESRLRSEFELSPTLTTQSGSQLMLVDGDRVRILNPRELARIQGWRDDECVLPKQRDICSRLIGNAIPVQLAHGVLDQMIAAL